MIYINSNAFVRPDGIPVALVKFAMLHGSGKVRLKEGVFDKYAWVNEKDVDKYDCIEGVTEKIKKAIAIFNKKE